MDWSYGEVNDAFCEFFPEIFDYLDDTSDSDEDAAAALPPWLLCLPSKTLKGRRLKIVPNFAPTGNTLYFNKGTSKASYSESFIFIGNRLLKLGNSPLTLNCCAAATRDPLPDSLLRSLRGGQSIPFQRSRDKSRDKCKGSSTSLRAGLVTDSQCRCR